MLFKRFLAGGLVVIVTSIYVLITTTSSLSMSVPPKEVEWIVPEDSPDSSEKHVGDLLLVNREEDVDTVHDMEEAAVRVVAYGNASTLLDTGLSYELTDFRPDTGYKLFCCRGDGQTGLVPVCCKRDGSARMTGPPCHSYLTKRVESQVRAVGEMRAFLPLDDTPMRCGTGSIDMQLKKNLAVYIDYNTCMDFVRSIKNNHRLCSKDIVVFHVYWVGPVNMEVLQVVRSFLATQDLTQSVLWVWSTHPEPTDVRWIQLSSAAGDRLDWKHYDLKSEIVGTPLDGRFKEIDVEDDLHWVDSDLFRVLILHNYGGVYLDADVMLLRDFAPIVGGEWLYQWGSSCNFANAAVLSLKKHSLLAKEFLSHMSTKDPRLGSFDWGRDLYHEVWKKQPFNVLPSCFFDVLWMFNAGGAHWPYATNFVGPFASHLHQKTRRQCIEEGGPLDNVSEWYTKRMRERLGSDVPGLSLPRHGDGSGCVRAEDEITLHGITIH